MASAEAALVLDQPPKTEADLPSTGTWRALVNETAMVDYLLVTEVTKNPDGFRGSIYMSKDRGKPLHIGPVWDYNEAFGMCCGYPIAGYQNQVRCMRVCCCVSNGWSCYRVVWTLKAAHWLV
eukprot:1153419-Pelagomonas_calceolata.AAC.6